MGWDWDGIGSPGGRRYRAPYGANNIVNNNNKVNDNEDNNNKDSVNEDNHNMMM